ncbi:hypothetical protein DSM43518_02026 [Mycobacterium marinum]|uniref:hypothetical protein n=1 Tax=Mycobacterium marinum TaxID=1781 RepID=UPI000E3BB219|nr:hypothetical protein [Mycobacterium marinum]RFZ11186.1 hypothetical protein DSM43518_02026 [Mycobacterium marinum]
MGIFALGNERVGIVTDVQDQVGGQPVVSALGQPQTTEVVVWVDGCSFEALVSASTKVGAFEQQGMTVTTSEPAWAFFPVVDGVISGVDDDDQPTTVAWSALKSDHRLRHNGLTYVLRGDAVLETDIRGAENHVFCACEREG